MWWDSAPSSRHRIISDTVDVRVVRQILPPGVEYAQKPNRGRPRLFWSDGSGRSVFATTGAMWERRHGGTMPSAVLPATGEPFVESLDTTRFDGGLVAQTPLRERYVMT